MLELFKKKLCFLKCLNVTAKMQDFKPFKLFLFETFK